ncbi:MAG: SBBP repeat-containing protein [Arenimonas sp.]
MEAALPHLERSGEIVQSNRGGWVIRGLAAALFSAVIVSPATATGHESQGGRLTTLPAAFERNAGQVERSIDFIARGSGYQAYLDARGAVIQLEEGAVSMRFEGARDVKAVALEPLGFRTSYFRGTGPADRFINVENFGKVRYPGVYAGIDLVYYGRDGLLEYDLVVAPRAAADAIRIAFPEATAVAIAQNGDLRLSVRDHTVVFHKPVAYQQIDGARQDVEVAYRVIGDRHVTFALGPYQRDAELVIDPLLAYSSFLWGNTTDVAVDAQGNIYVSGFTPATGLPTTGGYQTSTKGTRDAFVMKLNPAGTQVIYATYLGGRRGETFGRSIAVDASGSAYIAGTTTSSAFPTTTGAYQRSYAAGSSFVTKLNAAGNGLVYSTLVNGADLRAVAVDAAGSAHVAGNASAGTFTTTPNALRPTRAGGVVLRLNPTGSAAVYATYLGGSATEEVQGIAIGPDGNAHVAGATFSSDFPTVNAFQPAKGGGKDAFVVKLNADGSALLHSTFLGGSGNDHAMGIAVDSLGDVYVAGRTFSSNFPVTFGVFQPAKGHSDPVVSNAFITKLASTGSSLVYSSYVGGRWCLTAGVFSCFAFSSDDEGIDGATDVAVDAAGFAYVGGYANSVEFPRVDSLHGNIGPTGENERVPFVAKVNPGGDRLVHSTLLGTRAVGPKLHALALGPTGIVHGLGLGCCATTDLFPLSGGMPLGSNSNAFLVRLAPGRYPTTVTSSNTRVAGGQTVTLRAEVQGAVTPGMVSFANASGTLGTAPVINGAAMLTLTLPPGAHQITAVHDADGIVSPPVYQLVTAP